MLKGQTHTGTWNCVKWYSSLFCVANYWWFAPTSLSPSPLSLSLSPSVPSSPLLSLSFPLPLFPSTSLPFSFFLFFFNVCFQFLIFPSNCFPQGAQNLQSESILCKVHCSGGKSYTIYSCIKGKLVEVNEILFSHPQLLVEKVRNHQIAYVLLYLIFKQGCVNMFLFFSLFGFYLSLWSIIKSIQISFEVVIFRRGKNALNFASVKMLSWAYVQPENIHAIFEYSLYDLN